MFSVANKFPAMKTKSLLSGLAWLSLALFAAGCSTVDSRVAKNRAAFSTWPQAVQDKVAAGKIDVGFTPDQVRVALGDPDRIWSRQTADGMSEVWSYRDRGSRFSFGFGVGMGSYGSRGGSFGGIGLQTGPGAYRDDEKMGVVFNSRGVVSSVETTSRVR